MSISQYIKKYEKSSIKSDKKDFEKLLWNNERQMKCKFEIEKKVIDFSTVSSWLDIGCGTGDFFEYVLAKHDVSVVVGLDVTPEFLKISSEKNKKHHVKHICENIFTFSTDKTYDLITLSGIIQMCNEEEIVSIFSSLSGLLNIGGQVWLDTLNIDSTRWKGINENKRNKLCRFFDANELIEFLKNEKFNSIESNVFTYDLKIDKTNKAELLYAYAIK